MLRLMPSVVLVVALAASGCVRVDDYTVIPHVAGQLVDADTKQPIIGAALQFERFQKQPVMTNADGRFDIPPFVEKRWVVAIPDFHARWEHLFVRAAGYQPRQLSCANFRSYPHVTIVLRKLSASNQALQPTADRLENYKREN